MPREDKSSYYYPQGLHLGHIFYILRQIGNRDFSEPLRPVDYYGEPLNENSRQTRYRIWFMMGLGLIKDDRKEGDPRCYKDLTPFGMQWFVHLEKLENTSAIPSDFYELIGRWRMKHDARYYISFVKNLENIDPQFFKLIRYTLLKIDALRHFIKFFVHEKKTNNIENHRLYNEYFQTRFIQDFFDEKGLQQASSTSAEHRLPILVGLLESIKVMGGYFTTQNTLLKLPLFIELFGDNSEAKETKERRRNLIISYYTQIQTNPDFSMPLSEDINKLRSLFGASFLTRTYPIRQILPLDTLEEIGTLEEIQLPDVKQIEKEEIIEEEEQTLPLIGLSADEISNMISELDAHAGRGRKARKTPANQKQGDPKTKALVKQRDNYTCQICEEYTFLTPLNKEYVEVHHILPNGDDLPYNMVTVCPTCHEKFRFGNDTVKIEAYSKLEEKGILEKIERKMGVNPLVTLKEEEEISEDVFNALVS